jgi:hypothetical protein
MLRKSSPKPRFSPEEMKNMQRLANRGNVGAIKRQIDHMDHSKEIEHAFVHSPKSGRLVVIPHKKEITSDGRPMIKISNKTKLEFSKKFKTFIHTHPKRVFNNKEKLLVTPSVGDIFLFLKDPFQNDAIIIIDKNKVAATVTLKKTKGFLALSKRKQNEIITEFNLYLYKIASISRVSKKEFNNAKINGADVETEYQMQSEIDHMIRTGSTKKFGFVAKVVPTKGYVIKQNNNGDMEAFKK